MATNVDQNGEITAVTALKVGGEIELVASNSVTTGADSITITPCPLQRTRPTNRLIFSGGVINI